MWDEGIYTSMQTFSTTFILSQMLRSWKRHSFTTVSAKVFTNVPRLSIAVPHVSAVLPRTAKTRSTKSSSVPSAPKVRSLSSWLTLVKILEHGVDWPSWTLRARWRRLSGPLVLSLLILVRRPELWLFFLTTFRIRLMSKWVDGYFCYCDIDIIS